MFLRLHAPAAVATTSHTATDAAGAAIISAGCAVDAAADVAAAAATLSSECHHEWHMQWHERPNIVVGALPEHCLRAGVPLHHQRSRSHRALRLGGPRFSERCEL